MWRLILALHTPLSLRPYAVLRCGKGAAFLYSQARYGLRAQNSGTPKNSVKTDNAVPLNTI